MGEVYRAHDTRLDREVAIKVLPGFLTSNPDRLRRFEQEARAVAALNHPNILAVHQMGEHEGVPYLVSELLEGETLRDSLNRGPVPLRKAIDYGVQIAHGLAAAHAKGIVHRDLKPENLFVSQDGRVKILDFGLAKVDQPKYAIDLTPTMAHATEPGMAMGTMGYMSPEQVRGQATDQRSDIFALGAILHELVTGQRTFRKPTSADTISAILHEDPTSISQIAPNTPPGLQRVVQRCLEKNAEQRFQSASDLAFALEALADSALSSFNTGAVQESKRPDRLPGRAAAATLVILMIAAMVAYIWTRPTPVPTVSNYVQLTHDGQEKALIGTDGSRLYLGLGAFPFTGMAEISIEGGDLRRISILPSTNMVPVDLSPSGSQLLVVDGQGAPVKGPLWSVPILGGSPRRLGDAVAETGAWSPDSKMLAFSNQSDLFLAQADGTESRKVSTVNGGIKNIAWSPDGSHLGFDVWESNFGPTSLWEVSVDGTGLHRLLPDWHNPPDECCGKWTADGRYFVFKSNNQIWVMPRRDRFLHSAREPIRLTSSLFSVNSPLPGKDGKKLYVVGQTYRGELMRYDVKSGQFSTFLGGISAEYVAFSKDGKWVTYVSYPEGTLWRSKADGSERLQLTYPPVYAMLPRWSPDGKEIVFFEFEAGAGKQARIYEVSPLGGSPRQLMPDDPNSQRDPNWSPDGSKIVFAGNSNNVASAVRVLELASGQVSMLPGSQGLFSPRWSPDGRYIVAMTGDSSALLRFDFQTQKWTEIAKGSISWLNWSKDGQYIYILDFRGKGAVSRIRVTDQKTEQVVDLKDFVGVGRYSIALALAPDDSPVLLRDTGTQDVYSLDWEAP
jgi:eukaryotic-like serine/threonine-protein kinase